MDNLLSDLGVEHLALFIISITLIVFVLDRIPIALTALISSLILAISGAMDFEKVYSGFATPVTLLVFGMLIVGYALFETGAVSLVGKWILKSRLADNERHLLALLMLVAGLGSAILSNTALMATFIPLIGGMVASAPGNLTNKNLLMPLGMAASVGGTITLVGSTSQPVASAILSESGYGELGMFDFAPVALPMLIVLIVYMVTIGYRIEQRCFVFDDHSTIGGAAEDPPGNASVTWKTYVSICTLFFCIICFITGILPIEITALIGAATVLCTGCIGFEKAMKQLDWNTVLLIAFAQGIAAGMNDSGAGELVGRWSVSIVGSNPILLLAIAVVVTVILTNIMSNTATAAMMVPIFISIATGVGYNPFIFVLAIAIASNASIATPIGGTAMSQTLVAGYGFRDYLKLGLPITAVLSIMVIVATPAVFEFAPI
ncbi:cation transporter [Corynebacterium hadale]|uniref:Cation transporter n=1 Tax=Corynebacterium hadale TaxID=2026255 RepID=A0ABX4HAG6_9CORY|nr:cation transporter [Corynebacterium hadale]